MPVFVADSVGMAVRDGLAIYGRENLHKGDVIVCNHAAVQGQHLNNTVMYTPVLAGPAGEELIGFFAVNCHWIDIGGSAIGSVSYSSTDIFMEGLQSALDQALVQGRTHRRGLPDHREQHPLSARIAR